MKKVCGKCGKDFETKSPRKYCSNACSILVRVEKRKNWEQQFAKQRKEINKKEKICKECGGIFITNTLVKKYCSIKCAAIVANKKIRERAAALTAARKTDRESRVVTKRCTECGASFTTLHGRSRFCSSDCYKTYFEELKIARNVEWEGYL